MFFQSYNALRTRVRAFAAQSGDNHYISHRHDKINNLKTEIDCVYKREDGKEQKDHGTLSNAIGLRNGPPLFGSGATPGACQLLCALYHTPSQQMHHCTLHLPQRVDCTRPSVRTPGRSSGNGNSLRGGQLRCGG